MTTADVENETHLGDLPVLQTLPLTHFLNEKACSSQKHQQQLDVQTWQNKSFQFLADILMSKFEDLISKVTEKSPSRVKAKGKRLRSGQSDDERASSEPSSK